MYLPSSSPKSEQLSSLKADKAPGSDGITNEALQAGGLALWKVITKLFNECLDSEDVPFQWKKSSTIIIPKKGDREDLRNYRPIALLPTIYKVFTKVLVNRMSRQLDEQQPREQAGFRSGFSTTDHLQVLNQVLERSRECKIPLCLVFVDYEKAFDSIEINAVAYALIRQNIPKKYVQTLLNVNTGCSTTTSRSQSIEECGKGIPSLQNYSPLPSKTYFERSIGKTKAS